MKRKITVTDTRTGKQTTGEVEIRNYDHFLAQLKNPARVFKDKKKYTRKQKHKNKEN